MFTKRLERQNEMLSAKLEELKTTVKDTDLCNLELMVTCVELKKRVMDLEAEVEDTKRKLTGIDKLRHKVVADKATLAERYGKACQLISDMNGEVTKRYFCDMCLHSDGIVCCNEAPHCTFEVR